MIKRLFEWVDLSQRKLGTKVPLWTTDIQSPFSVAVQIVEHEEILMACYTNPKAIHHLCRMITDFTIDFMKQHIAKMEHACFPGRNFPSISENIGICIADDTPLVMLSPEMYMEFAYPYNAELGEIFGGIHIHSCGDYRHNLDSLLKLPTLKSIQLHAGRGEFSLPKTADEECAFNRARKQITCFVDSGNIAAGDGYKDRGQDHYIEYVLSRLKAGDMTGIILQSCGVSPDLPDVDSALKWTRGQVENDEL
jgi:uroporphyrinogen-III decarboxylase